MCIIKDKSNKFAGNFCEDIDKLNYEAPCVVCDKKYKVDKDQVAYAGVGGRCGRSCNFKWGMGSNALFNVIDLPSNAEIASWPVK